LKNAIHAVLLSYAAFFILAVSLIRADEPPRESAEMLARARKLEHLRTTSAAPFLLQAEIKAAIGKREIPGSYKLLWWSPDRWQEFVVLGDFRRMRDGVTDGYWQLRPLDYEPQTIFDLDGLLNLPSLLEIRPEEKVGKARMRKIGGNSLSCVEIDRKGARTRELCFDPMTGLLVHAERADTAQPGSDRAVFDYSGPIAISTSQFPSKLRLQRGKDNSIEVSIGRLQLVSEVQPPPPMSGSKDFEFWHTCLDPTPAVLENRVAPRVPDALKGTHAQGTVSFYGRIEPDGSLSHIKTLQSAASLLDRAAREAVEQWRYRPESCQGTPVKAETVIEIQFSPL
jgi:TonB family protein